MKPEPNILFIADPLDALQRVDNDQFDLIFLDPPFYGGFLFDLDNPQNPPYENFGEYLSYITKIFLQSHRVIKKTGSILLRISPLSPFNAKLFLDRIFGKQNLRAEIIWENRPTGRHSKLGLNINFESVLFYSKSDEFTYNEPIYEQSEKNIKLEYGHHDTKGYYKLWNLIDKIDRPGWNFMWKGNIPPKGSSWKYSEKRLDELYFNNEIDFSGKFPKRKIYLIEDSTRNPLGFVWRELKSIKQELSQTDQRLQKLLEMASNKGNLILDPFITPISLGTLAQSERNWVGISQFEIVSRKFSHLHSIRIEEIFSQDIQLINIVDNVVIPQNLRRLVESEARAVDTKVLNENHGQRFAFLVGINHYKDRLGDLNYCMNDVIELGITLTGLGYQVKTLHDDMEDDNFIPWRSNIETELKILALSLAPEDTLYVHFSGHGALVNNEALIITSDTRSLNVNNTSLHLKDVIDIMKTSRAKKLVLSLDICHGGVDVGRIIIDEEFVHNVYDNAEGFALLAASTAQQQAYELPEYEHGLFTYYLLEGLHGDADFDEDGRITVEDLRNYTLGCIQHWNAQNGGRQVPTYRNEGIGEITLVYPNL